MVDSSVLSSGRSWLLEAARAAAPSNAARLPASLPAGIVEAWRVVRHSSGLTGPALAEAAASVLGCQVADFAGLEAAAARLVPERFARRHVVLPIRATDRDCDVASPDPADVSLLPDLEFATGRSVRLVVADPEDIVAHLDALFSPERAIEAMVSGFGSAGEGSVILAEDLAPSDADADEDPTGAVRRLAATLLRDAVVQQASDIHMIQVGAQGIVRYRLDGVMRQVLTMPAPVFTRVVSRLKVIGKLDITERLRPQDGRSRIVVDDVPVDLRLSTLPVEGAGERVVIRLLRHEEIKSLDAMDIVEPERGQLMRLLGAMDGMVVMTGPTGSGKTTTLHAALRRRLSDDVTIITAENPVEYRIPGVAQVQVEPKQGVTFAAALRAILRQDPDIVLVGEIRDTETAETAAQAALTGHLVLTTVHAEDAPSALLRLRDLGLATDMLAESFRGAAAQRLLRRLCPRCAAPPDAASENALERLYREAVGMLPAARAVGCAECGYTGYRGRLPIHQVFTVTDTVREMLRRGADTSAVRAQARADGMRSLGESADTRIKAGLTTVEEAVRVLGQRFWDELRGETTATAAQPAPAGSESEMADAAVAAELDEVARLASEAVSTPRALVFSRSDEVRAALAAACADAGCAVVAAAQPHAAGQLAAAGGVRVAVLDLRHTPATPELAVGQLVDLRRALGDLALPVILVVPPQNPLLGPLLKAAGVDDYLMHPIDRAMLTARVRAALRRSSVEAEAKTA